MKLKKDAMIKVIDNIEKLESFEAEWTRLFAMDVEATPFQSYEYIKASIQFCNDKSLKPYIICVKNDQANQWIAIFPLYIDNKGVLTYINYQHTDFCLPIKDPTFDNYNLYKEFGEFLKAEKEITGVKWDNITQNSSLLSALKPHFRYSIVHDINYYSTISIYKLPNDKDSVDSFRYVQAKQRRNLRKTFSKINSSCDFQIFSASAGMSYPENQISELINKMVGDGIRSSEYFSKDMLAFWQQLYDNGVLSVALISQNGIVESANFMYYDSKHNQYIKWIMLYMDNSWNMKINLMIADYLYNNGGATINFARGIYDYKMVNFHPDVKPLFSLKIAKSRWGHFKNIISAAFHYSKPIIKSWLGR